ncbi:MAG: glycosyltransferase family 4 protein [Candidatus Eiseniibacteriota bacterium]
MAEKLRVLVVDHVAGVEPFRRKYEILAADPSLELTVFAPDRWIENRREVRAPASVEGYRILSGKVVWPGRENRAFFVGGLAAAVGRTRPHVLHLMEEPFSLIALQAAALCRTLHPRAKVVFYTFDNLYEGFRYSYRPSWAYGLFQRTVHRLSSAGVAACGDAGRILLSRRFEKPIRYVPLGVDVERYAAAPDPARRDALGLRGFVIGYVGRFLPIKGLSVLGDALSLLPGEWTLLAVGSGPEQEVLESKARQGGWSERLRIAGGVAHADVPALMALMDVLVLPSVTTPHFREQFGRVLIEAMCCRIPLIGSDSGSIPETMGEAGIVVPERDAPALAAALTRLMAEPAERKRLGEAGRRRAERHFTWERIAATYRSLWEELARGTLRSEAGPSWSPAAGAD